MNIKQWFSRTNSTESRIEALEKRIRVLESKTADFGGSDNYNSRVADIFCWGLGESQKTLSLRGAVRDLANACGYEFKTTAATTALVKKTKKR